MICAVIIMLQTIDIKDAVMHQIENQAASQGCTVSELVEDILESTFGSAPRNQTLPPLPLHHMGESRVCINNREALYAVMEQD